MPPLPEDLRWRSDPVRAMDRAAQKESRVPWPAQTSATVLRMAAREMGAATAPEFPPEDLDRNKWSTADRRLHRQIQGGRPRPSRSHSNRIQFIPTKRAR